MTYKTFTTAQEIFDHVVPLLFAQGQRSIGPNDLFAGEQCAYRGGKNGELRCAVGFLIPDELYHEDLEGRDVMSAAVVDVLKHVIPEESLNHYGLGRFLDDMQEAHDCWETGEEVDLYNMLWSIANRHNLELTALSNHNRGDHA